MKTTQSFAAIHFQPWNNQFRKGWLQKLTEACETNNVSFILNTPYPPLLPETKTKLQNRLQLSNKGRSGKCWPWSQRAAHKGTQ